MTVDRRQLILQLGLLSCASPALRAAPLPAANEDPALRRLLGERLRHEGVGLAAARLLPDGSLQLAADGRSGVGQALLTPDRHGFEIGSISKTFIGLLLADAVLRGELKLEDAVETQLGFPLRDREGQALRFVDLATHRSGLPRLAPNMAPANAADPYADYSEAQLLEVLRSFKATRRRDESFEYSNLGFGLLAWLIARRAKQPLAQLLEARVLAPLGLGGASGIKLQLRVIDGPGRVQGHDAKGQPVPAWTFSDTTAGAGALLASAAQLARYGQAMLGQLQQPLRDAVKLALTPHGPEQNGVRMGLGWMLFERDGQRIASHDGGTAGFASSLWLNLDRGHGGLVLSNAAVAVGDLARHLMDERSPLRDFEAERRVTQQAALSLSEAELASLAGVYALAPQFKVVVRARGKQLFAQATGQGEFELFAKGPRGFFAKVTALEIEFDASGSDGRPTGFTLLQGGRRSQARREGDEEAALQLKPEQLEALAGSYALRPDFKLVLRTEGARLFARATGQAEFELFAKSAREFFARVTPMTVRFDDGDPPPALRILQGGHESLFRRE